VQAPYEGARELTLNAIQATLNGLVFGGYTPMKITTAQQPVCDVGFGHIDLERRMAAEWALFARQLADCEQAPWKNIWWYRLRQVYGELCDRDFVFSTCAFKNLSLRSEPSQVQQLAMAHWGSVSFTPVRLEYPEMTERRSTRIELAEYDGVAPPVAQPVWQTAPRALTGKLVSQRRLWFDPCVSSASRMHERSTYFTEDEAIAWASHGLVRLKNVLAGSRLITQQAFRQDFPALDSSLIYETACGLPEQWRVALRDRTAASWFDGCLPRDLFEETEDYKPQHLAVTRPNTLVSRPPPRLETLRVAEVYGTMMASTFTMPRVFDTNAGPAAGHAHLFHGPTPSTAR